MTFEIGWHRPKGAPIRKPVTVDLSDLWSLHVIGSPGEGKSTFLGRLADACIEAGEGVLLLDPKGDLAVDVAERTRFPDRLIYLAPGLHKDCTFSFNVLEIPDDHPDRETYRNIVGDSLLRMFEHMGRFDPAFMAMIDTYLRAAVKTAYTNPNPTIIDVIGVLLSEVERDRLTAKTRRPEIKGFWAYFDKRSGPEQRNQIDSTLRRLWEFLLDDKTYLFVDHQHSTIHLGDWLNEGKLVVVNLSHGLPENDAERIGNLLVAYLTTQYRLRETELVPWDRSRRWRLIVDEFHHFSPKPYAKIIREGRGANFFPVLAHQDMGQLSDLGHIKDALGHVSKIAFRRSSADIPATSYEAQRQYLESQSEMQKHEADFTFRGPTGTSTQRIRMADWKEDAKEGQRQEAHRQAIQFTVPRSQFPSSRERFDAWGIGGTIENNEPSKNKRKNQTRTPPQKQEPRDVLPDDLHQARVGNAPVPGHVRLIDTPTAGAAAVFRGMGEGLEGEGEDDGPPPPAASWSDKKRQRDT
jgi:hypothetical protein